MTWEIKALAHWLNITVISQQEKSIWELFHMVLLPAFWIKRHYSGNLMLSSQIADILKTFAFKLSPLEAHGAGAFTVIGHISNQNLHRSNQRLPPDRISLQFCLAVFLSVNELLRKTGLILPHISQTAPPLNTRSSKMSAKQALLMWRILQKD